MAFVSDVFTAAMGLMDELSVTGAALTSDTREYEMRTAAIMNVMVSELMLLAGDDAPWLPVESLDDSVPQASQSFALGAMPYGLAANLLVDENPTAAGFYQQRYEELRNIYVAKRGASIESIENVYGGLEHTSYGRW